jgi:small subunit ribosomal protein S1
MSVGKAVSQKEELTSAQQEQMAHITKLDSVTPKENIASTTEEKSDKKSKTGKATKAEIRELLENKKIVSGTITAVNRGGLSVKILGHNAFCPLSQFDTKKLKPEDLNSYLTHVYDFMVVKIESKGTNIILSRIPLVAGDIEERVVEIEEIAKNGGTVSGVVSGILLDKNKKDEMGAFVDLGNVEGLVHISELSWTRATKVNDIVKVGATYTFKVLSVERKEPLTATKVKLSLKKVEEDPWKNIESQIKIGSMVDATVTRIVNNGVFIRLEQHNIEALIRTEDLGWEKIRKISEVVKKGQEVSAKVININLEKHQIDCSLKDEKKDPWINITSKYKDGTSVKGIIADEKEYGYFVDLEPGITGLLSKSRIAGEKGKKNNLWKKGEEVDVVVQYIDTEERKMVLSFGEIELTPAQISDKPKKKKEKLPKSSKQSSAVSYDTAKTSSDTEISEFASLLKNALKK